MLCLSSDRKSYFDRCLATNMSFWLTYSSWWPFFVVIFYVLAPLPTIIARRYQDDVGSSNACKELALFLTAGIVISAYGLPIVLSRSPVPQAIVSHFLIICLFCLNRFVFVLSEKFIFQYLTQNFCFFSFFSLYLVSKHRKCCLDWKIFDVILYYRWRPAPVF